MPGEIEPISFFGWRGITHPANTVCIPFSQWRGTPIHLTGGYPNCAEGVPRSGQDEVPP